MSNPFSPTTASKAAFLVAALVGATYLTEVAFGGQTEEVSPAPESDEQAYERPDQDPDYVSPDELKEVFKQFRDLRRDIKRTLKMLVKIPNSSDDKNKLNGLFAQLAIWEKNLRNPPADTAKREVLQEFYDANVWDDINAVQRKVRIPKDIREGEKALARSEKVWKSARAKKYLSDLIPKATDYLGFVRNALEQAKVAFASGDLESAEEALRSIFDTNHPGELEGTFHMMSVIREGLRRIKDPEIKAIIEELLQPINESLAQGEYRDANQALNEVQEEINRVIEIASRAPKRRPQNFEDKLRRLEDLLQQKFGGQEREEEKTVAQPEEKVGARPYLGGWKVETVFGLDAQGQWSATVQPPHNPTYVEFNNESSCITEAVDLTCESYLAGYEVRGDIISFPGATGSRFRWEIVGEKLVLVNEDRAGDSWNPSVKFISVKVK